ncbi:MAG: low specificity L-threonine aldolase [Dehalococcoidia bacterium]
MSLSPSEVDDLLKRCTNVLPGHGPRRTIAESMREVADWLVGNEQADVYGKGDYLQAFEAEVAEMFGKPAAVFMPSGTMAQQVALRIWCDRNGRNTVAMHPTAHLEFAEHLAYQYLHRLHRLQFGGPEFISHRMLTIEDFQALGGTPGAVLLELPYRPLGGQLPPWDDLEATRAWATERGVALHLDGARIWQCRGYYDKTYADIGALFDSIYVSFYKELGAFSGAMLLGPEDFIQEARVWQRRHGGNLFTLAPFVASARMGLANTLPRLEDWVRKAREIGGIMATIQGVRINPDPVQVNFFQVYFEGERDALVDRHHLLAGETGTFLFRDLRESGVPGLATTELHMFENAMNFDAHQLAPFLERLMDV